MFYVLNKKILYGGGAILLVLLLFLSFKVFENRKITNYPSTGTDIIAFGDSLVEGVGATSSKNNFVSRLSEKIRKPIINLGVSGNTTADGLARINELDRYKPKVVLLLLGGNDSLRKVPVATTFSNLEKIIQNIQARGAAVVLLGVRGSILGDKYESEFERLAEKYHTAYVSDVLSGLITDSRYMADGIHPNDIGYGKIADRVYPVLLDVLK